MSLCRHCIGTIKHGAPRPSIRAVRSLATTSRLQSDTADELRKAKERAWYLEPAPLPNRAEGSRTPAARQSQPRFTTFDPESTRSDISPQSIVPLPDNATDPLLVKLHEHLTTQSDSVDPSTVRFLHPSSSRILQDHGGIEGSLLGESGGTSWQWVVVCQVRGRGRGVVNRAEKEIRKWMREELGRRTRSRTASRAESDTDWAMVHVGDGVCVNLFTAEGRERWNLEELWA